MLRNFWLSSSVVFLLLTLTMIASISYSKYTSISASNTNLEVADWKIIINDEEINDNVTFDLFDNVNSESVRNDVRVIAPGTSGYVTLEIINLSNVVAEYTITAKEVLNEGNIPILYSLDENGEYKELDELIIADNIEIDYSENNNKIIKLYWKWDFYIDSVSNQKDNELGNTGDSLLKINISIKANQKI